jgi:hypothetical protein
LTRLINDRPGKLLKLITAVGFATAAVIVAGRSALTRETDALEAQQPKQASADADLSEVISAN